MGLTEVEEVGFEDDLDFFTVVTTTGEWEWEVEVDLERGFGLEAADLTEVEVEDDFDFEVVEVELFVVEVEELKKFIMNQRLQFEGPKSRQVQQNRKEKNEWNGMT